MVLSMSTTIPEFVRPYIKPCSVCGRGTWWREMGTGIPLCMRCGIDGGRDGVNSVPREVRQQWLNLEADKRGKDA